MRFGYPASIKLQGPAAEIRYWEVRYPYISDVMKVKNKREFTT